jgi:replicative DNA helicase
MSQPGFRHDDREGMQLRIPPHSIDAEQAVLGGVMLVPRSIDEVADVLQASDFYRRDHQLIWQAITELHAKEKPYDSVTMADWFDAQGQGEQIGHGAYLVELSSTTPSAANIRAYAEIVADKARMRDLIETGTVLINDGFAPDGRSSVEIVGQAQSRLGGLLKHQPCDLEPVTPIMQRVYERLQARIERGPGIEGLSFGMDELDEITNGLGKGQVIIVAGRPGMGKSTLAQNVVEAVAVGQRVPAAIFSFEMQPDEFGDRLACSMGGIDSDRLRKGTLEDEDWSKLTAAIKDLRGAEILISRPRAARVEHVIAQFRRQHAKKPLGVVVIDYLQLMETRGDNLADGLGDITRALKLAAGELGITIILLSQLNRELEKRTDKRPVMADLRSSGSIEQDADVIVFIYRDEYYNKNSPDKGTAELIVAKQRGGRTGTVRVKCDLSKYRFENLAQGWLPEIRDPSDGATTPRPRFRKSAPGGRAAMPQEA